ncbi:MAG: YidC/Oxa1 family membrane protein insertase [Clostridia bacterium]|nr:YidC/Oxa1 family membrane protein insertase [Clostridia bacterium]
MGFLNLLDKAIPVYTQTFDISLNFIGKMTKALIELFGKAGLVGIGIIVFSLILKLIVLPFDIYQRIAMRKQNQKMKEQQVRMERLQKQYANDKAMYNQKLMEMYKENGISMFSSCLPMILSLIVFIVAINGFNAYAQYSNVYNYNTLVKAYNTKIESYCPELKDEYISVEGDKIIVKSDDAYIYYQLPADPNAEDIKAYIEANNDKHYYINAEKAAQNKEIQALVEEGLTVENAAYQYFVGEAQSAVKEVYENGFNGEKSISEKTRFIWIKNIWVTDASYRHPVLTHEEFSSELTRSKFDVNGERIKLSNIKAYAGDVYDKDVYDSITAKLTVQKKQANGYFILVALSIGTILLQQFVMMRSQKEQQKFSSVDGQAASQQKMTMFIMTGMFAIFSFMYSSAFSIYMITSNIFSLVSTLIINKFVDKSLDKQAEAAANERLDNRGLARIEAAKNAGKNSAQESRDKKNKN